LLVGGGAQVAASRILVVMVNPNLDLRTMTNEHF